MNSVGLQYEDKLKEAGIICGQSPVMQTLDAMVEDLASTNIPVLLVGESGAGKDVYARMIHLLSSQSARPLKKIACAAIDPARLQSELQKMETNVGDVENTSHLFLDSIEELDGTCQRVLLTHLPDGSEWGSGSASLPTVISATTRDLEKEVESGRFRRELYFRINGACLRLPPLRERREDITLLLDYFLRKHKQEIKKIVPQLDQETIDTLLAYDWPGNIRELENLARKMVALGDFRLPLNDLRGNSVDRTQPSNSDSGPSLKTAARSASRQRERELILEALDRTKWNRKKAARELQISYKALLYKLKQIGTLGAGTLR